MHSASRPMNWSRRSNVASPRTASSAPASATSNGRQPPDAPEGGGVAIAAAVAPDSGLNAGELIADAARAVKGGGGKGADLAVAGGKEPAALDAALDLARAAAGV